jgi:hypothetical protein
MSGTAFLCSLHEFKQRPDDTTIGVFCQAARRKPGFVFCGCADSMQREVSLSFRSVERDSMKLFTIGFTRSSAAHFFGRLKAAGVTRLIDVRLKRNSQLAGFAKEGDLAWFARKLCGIETVAIPDLAPTAEMLRAYRAREIDWPEYAARFRRLIARRRIETVLDRKRLDGACLLCSEALPHHCHRRVVAAYLQEKWGEVEVVDL